MCGQNGGNQGTNDNTNNGTSQEGGSNPSSNQPSQTGNQPNQPSVGQSGSNPPSRGSSGSGGNTGSQGQGSSGSKVRVGSIIGTGDIVAIRSNEDGSNQFKATMSVTKSNTDNTKAKGALLNFTTAVNNSNLTFYGAFTNKKKSNTLIFANSSMLNFNYDLFNTTTVMESHRWGKLSLMGGANFTIGSLAEESFTNRSAIVTGKQIIIKIQH